jgi:acyl-coenzyme A synthetase/AMP-(fatty) acid ligase
VPASTPLITHTPERTLAWREGGPISAAAFARDVLRLARALPEGRQLVNLCEDRYRFMVGFAAAMQRGLITLMPHTSTPGAINQLLEDDRESYCLSDSVVEGIQAPHFDFEQLLRGQPTAGDGRLQSIAAERTVAILYTSGSTGHPKANPKRWFNLQREALSALGHFPFRRHGINSLLATVPSQHMYGLATAILFPWQGGFAVDTGRPFFPADIAATLARLPAPRVLITTPLHLRACVSAGIEWPEVAFVISATAPLSAELAESAERQLMTQVFEIYGSTETGSVAGRRTAREDHWRLYDGISLQADQAGHEILGGHLSEPVRLHDRLQIESPGSFRFLGRDSDMVKIAGKRASLSHLTHQLLNIPGVEDGIFLPPNEDSPQARLRALVVAPTLSKPQILNALAHSLDAAFLPRPLYCVERLPRNETGKLPRSALQKLLRTLQSDSL